MAIAGKSPKGELEVRERIFESALRHFSSKGYAATSLREVADDAQTTKPMIYYYFGSKVGLYGGIVRQILQDMAETIMARLDPELSYGEQVIRYCESYLEYFASKEEVIALVLREVFGLGGASMDTFADSLANNVRKPLDDILYAGIDAGSFNEDEVDVCALAITGILNMFILAHVFGGSPFDASKPLRQVRHLVDGLSV